MTREEAIEVLKDIYNYTRFDTYTTNEARTIAIKALEQEPCDDVISREEAIDACNQSVNILEATDRIKDLPPVTPKQKIGRWIPVSERLPKAFEHCLWTTAEGDVIYHHWDGQISKYKAWMPLPKPYKTESEDNNEMSVSDKSNS